MHSKLLIVLLICVLSIIEVYGKGCSRTPPSNLRTGGKKIGDNGYRIVIADATNGYVPGKTYNLYLLGSRTHDKLQQFTHFILNAQLSSGPDIKSATMSRASPKRVGRFQLFSDALTKFSEDCTNTVLQSDDLPKSEVQVMWVAPQSGSGCVAVSAMVYESPQNWYADDGALTQIVCESTLESTPTADQCCACDEAKYSLVFEGIWSNETHPRDYPFAIWLTHFSDVIGATHDSNFSFWGENHIATDGFRSLAEWGSVRLLETELRAKGPRLRTLIKAAGLWYPNVNTNTSSNFRADRIHHKLSLASMFGPSPDWVVGVNGLNLCKADCTWHDSFDIDLYPWDAGTDNGITYMSPNSETQPRERMYRITPMYPEDPRQPFYDSKNSSMTPLAKLYIRKEKTIPRNCDVAFLQSQLDVSENTEEGTTRPGCEVTEFTEWTPCSVTCGKGIRSRTRQYRNQALASASQCNKQLISREMCVANIPECEASQDEDKDTENITATVDDAGEGIGVCRTTKWSEWSPCSATCGIGISMRTKTFIEHIGRKKCPHISVVEKEKCMKPECEMGQIEIPDPMCPVTIWSDWSPCSTSCGNGVRIRTRLLLVETPLVAECSRRLKLNEQQPCENSQSCTINAEAAKEICSQEQVVGPCRGQYNRFAYDNSEKRCAQFVYGGCRGNQNNFLTLNECEQVCGNATVVSSSIGSTTSSQKCTYSEWSDWSECSVSCGYGYATRTKELLTQGVGEPCRQKKQNRKRCRLAKCVEL